MADRIAFAPEAVPQLKARMPAALAYVYDERAVRYSAAIRPGEVRANCFDWPDGLRVVVARVKLGGTTEVMVQATAWAERGSEVFGALAARIVKAGRRDEEAIRGVLSEWGRRDVLARLVEVGAPPVEFAGLGGGGAVLFSGPDVKGESNATGG